MAFACVLLNLFRLQRVLFGDKQTIIGVLRCRMESKSLIGSICLEISHSNTDVIAPQLSEGRVSTNAMFNLISFSF